MVCQWGIDSELTSERRAHLGRDRRRPWRRRDGPRAAGPDGAVGGLLSPDGTLLFGRDADRLAATDPARGARAFKRRVGDADPVGPGRTVLLPQELFAGFLAWTVSVAAQRQGAAPDELVVPYPASWSGHRRC